MKWRCTVIFGLNTTLRQNQQGLLRMIRAIEASDWPTLDIVSARTCVIDRYSSNLFILSF
jgi:hypothetical protein